MTVSDNEHDRTQPESRAAGAQGRTVSVSLDDDLAARLASFQRRHTDFSDTAFAARHILRVWLTENGFDGIHKDAGTRPEALNSSNDG